MTAPELTAEQHWAGFVRHASAVQAAGWNWLECLKRYAADPGYERDPAWVAFAHGVCYGFPSTAKLLERWPNAHDVLDRSPGKVEDWFALQKLPFRKERLRHSSPKQAAETLRSAAQVCAMFELPQLVYDDLWSLVKSVKRFGRYQTIKVCGVLEALGATRAKQPDIRAQGAKLGRRTLGTLREDMPGLECAASRHVEGAATQVLERLVASGVDMTANPYLRLESLLCEYQQMLAGRFHADRGLQKDVGEWAQLFGVHYAPHDPSASLPSAPFQPWQYPGPFRPELDRVYRDRGYVWSDAWYDWDATTDLDDPVPQRRGRPDIVA